MNADTVRRLSSEQIARMLDNIAREIAALQADQRVLLEERERRASAKWPQRATK
jgi:hypothetical protein